MTRMLLFVVLGGTMMLMHSAMYAQGYPWGGQRGGVYSDRGGWRGSGSPVQRVLSDLDRIQARSRVDNHERNHFNEARKDLYRFEERWRDGRFDSGRLNKAMDNIEHLARSRQIHPRDRSVLGQDLRILGQLRSGRGPYGRNGPYGYRDPW
jgi:hypothetical protein